MQDSLSNHAQAVIVVGGRFHAFKLGEQLEKRNFLKKIITSNPRFTLRDERVDPKKVQTFPLAELVGRGWNRLTGSNAGDYWKDILFDAYASKNLRDAQVLIGWAGYCKRSMETVRKRGGKIILDRPCPHTLEQEKLIQEESRSLGLRHRTDPRVVDRMLAEYELADRIVVPSLYSMRSFLARGFDEKKVKLAPQSGRFLCSTLPVKSNDGVFRVLFVGGHWLRKGIVYLLRAWDRLRLPNAELILRTSGRCDNAEIRRLLSNPTIRFAPYQAELGSLYSRSSVLCLPSIDDGFGLVVIEAMTHGLPVIVTHNVGSADCVRDNTDGFIIPIRSVTAIEDKLGYFYEHREELSRMSKNAAVQAKPFTWEAHGNAYWSVIQELIGGSKPHAE